ncbi:hypothetical protein AGMMS49975_11800 [Clostridia bacterium]|nr:hypothetical protein AGMMS49975_11800 [Clostridia bacterium]
MEDTLIHHGILGMKWGVRRTPSQLGYSKGMSSKTKKVIDNYNKMSDGDFKAKYKTSKSTYAKRVDKYGDPYMNAPLAKLGKKLSAKNVEKKKKVKLADMSDDELKARISRLNLEQQYSKLAPSIIDRGKTYAKNGLKIAGGAAALTTAAITLYNNSNTIQGLIRGTS